MSLADGPPAPQAVWASLDASPAQRSLRQQRGGRGQRRADRGPQRRLREVSPSPSGRPRHPLCAGRRMGFDLYPARRARARLPCLHPWRLLAAQFPRVLRHLCRRVGRGRLVGRDAGLFARAARRGSRQSCRRSAQRSTGSPIMGRRTGSPGPWSLAGWSAGAQLAAMHLGHRLVAAGLAISGVYDLGPLRDTALNDALNLSDEEIATLSPLRLPPTLKPLAIAYGTRRASRARSRFPRPPCACAPLRTRRARCCRSRARITSAFSKSCVAREASSSAPRNG